jgi:dipeptidyl aminopeptidase/acylaminoacyl peptidase
MLTAPASRAEQAMTPEQALGFVRIGNLAFSPDGSRLAFLSVSYRWDYRPHLSVMDVATGALHALTPDGKSERAPLWSPDGKTLAFLSNRGGKTQVYTMPSSGGDAVALTACKWGVDSFDWSPDGRSIAYLAKDDDAPDEDTGPQLADDDKSLSRLRILDIAAKTTRPLSRAGLRIDEFQWQTPSRILAVATDTPRVEEFDDSVYAIATANGATTLVAQPPQPFERLLVSPDRTQFALRSTVKHGPSPRDLFVGSGKDLHDVSQNPGLAVADVKWHAQDTIWLRVLDGFYNRLWRLPVGGAASKIDLPLSVDAFDVAHDGRIAFVGEDFAHLPELYLRDAKGSIRQLGEMQAAAADIHLSPARIFHTRSFDGTDIESALIKPALPAPHGKYPLLLWVHGGPGANFTTGYGWEQAFGQLMAAHGYEVLLVNPRGSGGYSEDFEMANKADWGGGDYKDLLAVLDSVIAQGETDPDRLAIGGWSYGAEMSEWATTQTNRFKAAFVGAGVFDQEAEFETEDEPAADEWGFGTPWEHPDVYARNSPSTYIRHAHTPTLIVDGVDDEANPVGQSKGLYRALKHFGVETQMVLYPDEGHSPRKGSYNIDMFERMLGWYDKYVGNGS